MEGEGAPKGIFKKIKAAFNEARNQLKTADLNPHEGRLRGSAMPKEYMNIPDSVPPTSEKENPES